MCVFETFRGLFATSAQIARLHFFFVRNCEGKTDVGFFVRVCCREATTKLNPI